MRNVFNANENKGLANRNAGFNCGICHKIMDASHCALKSRFDQPPQGPRKHAMQGDIRV